MVPQHRFREILKNLLKKSKANLVKWDQSERDPSQSSETYKVYFGEGRAITVNFESPDAAPDYVEAILWIGDALVAKLEAEEGDDDWPLLLGLADDARRGVIGWDSAVEAIEKALQSNEPVGHLFNQDVPPAGVPF